MGKRFIFLQIKAKYKKDNFKQNILVKKLHNK